MVKETVTFEDFNGVTRTQDYYFNMMESELIELQYSVQGGLASMLEAIIAAKNEPEIVKVFKKILLMSYGRKTPDGLGFEKSEELSRQFACTPAYSKIFTRMCQDENAMAEFINKLIPSDMAKKLDELQKESRADAAPLA